MATRCCGRPSGSGDTQQRNVIKFDVEVVLRNPRPQSWKSSCAGDLTDNPMLLALSAWSHTQDIRLSNTVTLRTLSDDHLLPIYALTAPATVGPEAKMAGGCKSALIVQKSDAEIERLYDTLPNRVGARRMRRGRRCFFVTALAIAAAGRAKGRSFQDSKRLKILAAMALYMVFSGIAKPKLKAGGLVRSHNARAILAGQELGDFLFPLKVGWSSVRRGDAIRFPLPPGLRFSIQFSASIMALAARQVGHCRARPAPYETAAAARAVSSPLEPVIDAQPDNVRPEVGIRRCPAVSRVASLRCQGRHTDMSSFMVQFDALNAYSTPAPAVQPTLLVAWLPPVGVETVMSPSWRLRR